MESNLSLTNFENGLEIIKEKYITLLKKESKNSFSTIADLDDIFDNYKNETFKLYFIQYQIKFTQDEILYQKLLKCWDDFKMHLNFEINCYPNKRISI